MHRLLITFQIWFHLIYRPFDANHMENYQTVALHKKLRSWHSLAKMWMLFCLQALDYYFRLYHFNIWLEDCPLLLFWYMSEDGIGDVIKNM